MRIYRCFHAGPISPGSRIQLDEEESRHLISVRRTVADDDVIVADGAGREYRARLVEANRKHSELEVLALTRETPRPIARELYCALTKSADFDEMFQRAVELGMTSFTPLLTERTVVEWPADRGARKIERWHRLAIEALKQCERLWLPEVRPPRTLEQALEDLARLSRPRLILTERRQGLLPAVRWFADHRKEPCALLIGPEGGWSLSELAIAEGAGAIPVTLGEAAILRTETAALATLALAFAHEG